MNNLADIQRKVAEQNVKIVDSSLVTYIQKAVDNLTVRGEKIEDYTLVKVDNPMQMKKDKLVISGQWRIVKVSELEGLSTYGDE